ncbi:DNA mismatch repair protein Msh6 [Apostichopus japonicus]|uniref:DNA mismatch repair protein Msh6 n=1 Tax=Stichopus japonicus TaxID=307972 RepID=A0A2G8JMS6_STIJA|nr:DNA mismatch repair protein Msh6 [Apostichopus japonicus]
MKMSPDERKDLVLCIPSDEESEDEDDMDVVDGSDGSSDSAEEAESKKRAQSRPKRAAGNKAKRRRVVAMPSDSESSGEEFKPESDDDDHESEGSSGVDEKDITESETDPDTPKSVSEAVHPSTPAVRTAPSSTPAKKVSADFSTPSSKQSTPSRKPSTPSHQQSTPSHKQSTPVRKPSTPSTPVVSSATKSKLSAFHATDVSTPSKVTESEHESYPHNKLSWLQPDNLRDAKGHLKTREDYDPRTLKVPQSFLDKCTPAIRQWWDIKAKHFDTVLFFKMGKFYELFNMDAEVGVKELGLIYMKGENAHCGFPEIAFARYSDTLIKKGYKVARIEQTETPDMMQERCRGLGRMATKFDKVVKREVCRVSSKGTRTYSFIDGDSCDSQSSYLLAVAERSEGDTVGEESTYGVCFVDTSIGKFHIGQFRDDRHSSRFRTLISHHSPAQVLLERGKLSQKSHQIIQNNLLSVLKDQLVPGSEFWSAQKTLKVLSDKNCFEDTVKDKKMQMTTYKIGQTLSKRWFQRVLDGISLSNLEILQNSLTGDQDGTLLERLDRCSTPFGKRLFRQWLCAPLCNPNSINDRLNAVEDLMEHQDQVTEAVEVLKKLPDLERFLSKIHSLGSLRKSEDHPDGRAIFFEDATYGKRKILDFLTTLDGFQDAGDILKIFQKRAPKFKSKILRQSLLLEREDDNKGGRYPDLKEHLDLFDNAFDKKKAKDAGAIVPRPGVDEDYDEALRDIKATQRKFDEYLEKQRRRLGCSSIKYWGSAKNRFQLEVPEAALSRKTPEEYELQSSKKGFKRYWTPVITDLLADLITAEDRRDVALKDSMRRVFHKFDEHYKQWDQAVQCLAVIDVLISLSNFSMAGEDVMCRPEFVEPTKDTKPFIAIENGRHPCIVRTFSGGDYIPNHTYIGTSDGSLANLTGDDRRPSQQHTTAHYAACISLTLECTHPR